MGRKAKDAAQQKITQWTGAKRNVSKSATKNENTNATSENRIPLQTASQSDMNAMKNCSVRLEILQLDPKTNEPAKKTPAPKTQPAADVITKDKQADAKVYDYSFDADETGPTTNDDEMQNIFQKLAKENKIEVKKYKAKNVRGKKKEETEKGKKVVNQKRRREKQPADTEPPKKKPNLKNKMVSVEAPKSVAPSINVATRPKRNVEAENVANNNIPSKQLTVPKKVVDIISIETLPRRPVKPINTENKDVQQDLRKNIQSIANASTPLGTKTAGINKNRRSLNTVFSEYGSPTSVPTRSTRANILKQRLQLSAINDSLENEAAGNSKQNQENRNSPAQFNFDDDDFGGFGNDQPADEDKENSHDRPGTTAASSSKSNRPQTSSVLSELNRPSTSKGVFSSWDQPSTSSAGMTPIRNESDRNILGIQGNSGNSVFSQNAEKSKTPTFLSGLIRARNKKSGLSPSENQNISPAGRSTGSNENDKSILVIRESSVPNIFSPTKRRVYGRSPLKNITSEVNNTNSPSFESLQSVPSLGPSFGSFQKSTVNSIQTINSTKESTHVLPEASYFSSRRVSTDFDRSAENKSFNDDCFGFDVDDDDFDETNNTNKPDETEQVSKPEPVKSALKDIRANLKRFLRNPDGEANASSKQSKTEVTNKIKPKNVKSPFKSPAKTVSSPAKQTRHVVFGDGVKQKDIRSAFTTKSNDKHKNDKAEAAHLFEEAEEVKQDRRRSYSRPQRQRKRRISIDSDEESEEEQQSGDEDFDDKGKPTKRYKRRKKMAEPNPKEIEEFEAFARATNAHFDEVDSFEMVVE